MELLSREIAKVVNQMNLRQWRGSTLAVVHAIVSSNCLSKKSQIGCDLSYEQVVL